MSQTHYFAMNISGGPPGISHPQFVTGYKDNDMVNTRTILRNSWNNVNVKNQINGHGRILTPFRAVYNLGDYLGRVNYVCGGPNQINKTYANKGGRFGSIISECDTTGIVAGSGNAKYVSDSSLYTRYKREVNIGKNYNKEKDGGYTNSAYVELLAVRRK